MAGNELWALPITQSCYIRFMTNVLGKKTTTEMTFTQLACTRNTGFTLVECVNTPGAGKAGNKEWQKRKQFFEAIGCCFRPPEEHYLSSHVVTIPIKVIELSIKGDVMATSIYRASPIALVFSAAPEPFLAGTRREQKSCVFSSHQERPVGEPRNKPGSSLAQTW